MTRFLLFVRAIAPLAYAVAAIGIFLGVRSLWIARGALSVAQFSLEKEQAEERGGKAITQIIVLIEIAVLVYLLTNITATAWERFTTGEEPEQPAPQADFRTAVPLSGEEGFVVPTQPIEGPQIQRTPKPSPTPAGTLRPADARVGCIAEQADITVPANGQVIFEVSPIQGTANIQNFGYYRFEIMNVEAGDQFFGVIGGAASDHNTPVENGPLGSIIPQNFAPGEYRFRMTVFDTGGVMRGACEITIFISEPLPTATPIGAGLPPQTQ